ncbi:hypothetical protein DL767_008672 [Monosporascus sp. MG133]|nr:hypothetical protein DL767_008672 [Monosporascus sp. MG133]
MMYEGDAINQGYPNSSVTRYYNFDVARARLSPDGFEKEMIVINGQFPGPLIEANWGDWISVNVTNSVRDPEEGTATHWHAFLQQETPLYDGVQSVQQCPIAPGSSFTYTFRADHVGTSFYRSHYFAQIAGGASAPIVINGPQHQDFDYDIGPPILGLASQGNISYPFLSAGPGEWDGTIVNPENPLRRDTHILQPGDHLVTQFQADNPGIWPYHCHIAWHVSSGFYVNIMERPDDLLHRPKIPQVVDEACRDWNEWSRHNIVTQIGSGVKAKAKSRIRMMRQEQVGEQFHW